MLTKAEIHRLRSLRDKRHREALGLFVIEGEKVVGELLGAGFPLIEVYGTDAWLEPDRTLPPGVAPLRIVRVRGDEMARISHFPTPSTVLAVGRISRPSLSHGALAQGLTLALDGVQDAGNVGTLLRIADWYGLDRVLLSPDSADVFNQKAINASMGSFARIAAHVVDLGKTLGDASVPILGCDLAGDDVHQLPPARDAVIVIGNEGHGLSSAVAARVTRRVTIPRYGRAESLNAAVAAAIVCDNLRRLAR